MWLLFLPNPNIIIQFQNCKCILTHYAQWMIEKSPFVIIRVFCVLIIFNIFTQIALRPDFTSKLVRELAFGTPKFYIAPYDKINHGLVNISSNCDVKSGLRLMQIV